MKTGNLQRRWQEEKPQVYDKETRIVCLDIRQEKRKEGGGDQDVEKDGWSFLAVEIDSHIDYAHIKSQLIEEGFAQKDEFGLLMNAVDNIIGALVGSDTFDEVRLKLDTEDVRSFIGFCAFREMCAEAAKEVLKAY